MHQLWTHAEVSQINTYFSNSEMRYSAIVDGRDAPTDVVTSRVLCELTCDCPGRPSPAVLPVGSASSHCSAPRRSLAFYSQYSRRIIFQLSSLIGPYTLFSYVDFLVLISCF